MTVLYPSGFALLSIHSALLKNIQRAPPWHSKPQGKTNLLKEFVFALGSADGLQGFLFKSPEFWVHPGEGAEQMTLLLFGISESSRGLPIGTRSVVNV